MDLDKKAKRQNRRVIISEILMTITVIVSVAILALLVSGYWINSDFTVERQGMLQVASYPSGATVLIDDTSSWLQKTNLSKVLASGKHQITIEKPGYDSWQKTVDIQEGLLYRLPYPRLFLTDRTSEKLLDVSKYTSASFSPDHNSLLLTNNTTEWGLIDLNKDTPSIKPIDISATFSSVSIANDATVGLFTGTIQNLTWAQDNEHILFEIESSHGREWIVVNIKNPSEKSNITRMFAANFSNVRIANSSASILLATLNNNLHRIDVSSRQLSEILVENIHHFNIYGSTVVFSSDRPVTSQEQEQAAETPSPYYIGTIKLTGGKITKVINTYATSTPTLIKFYDTEYIIVVENSLATLYSLPDLTEILSAPLPFTPSNITTTKNSSFIVLSNGAQLSTIDMEAASLTNWNIESPTYGQLDEYLFYSINNSTLSVHDPDGQNPRILSKQVSANFPATITDNRWLYYFHDGSLIREIIKN